MAPQREPVHVFLASRSAPLGPMTTLRALVSAQMLVIILLYFVLYARHAHHLKFIVKWKSFVR
jgi:hypothetical protein